MDLFRLGLDTADGTEVRELNTLRYDKKWDDDVKCFNDMVKRENDMCPIVEVYSRPRVDKIARMWGILPGMSMDLTTVDEKTDNHGTSMSRLSVTKLKA